MHRNRPVAPRSRAGDRRHRAGRAGEELAARHLTHRGFIVLERNLRRPGGEIDLIAFDGHTLVFAEVKTLVVRRGSDLPGSGSSATEASPLVGLRPRQRARLRRMAGAWLSEPGAARPTARELRFDAIGVLLDSRGRLLRLDHLEAAW